MLHNFFKIAIRNLFRNKGFSFINIAGLAVGMAGAILISLWIHNELTYDQFHAKKDRLYKAWNISEYNGEINTWDVTTAPLGPALKQAYPEIKDMARVYWPVRRLFTFGNKALNATGLDVDPAFLTMFSFPLVKGNAISALKDINSVVLTETLAKKIFGNTDPLNKIVKLTDKDLFKVTGVVKDLPNNTTFDFEYLIPFNYVVKQGWFSVNDWSTYSYNTYIELQPNISLDAVNKKIRNITVEHNPLEKASVFLHPIAKWRLYSRFENGKIAGGRIEIVRLFALLGGLILIIACINFMNLSTARSEKRAKEVGIRKVAGAQKKSLIFQFLAESILFATLAGALALLLVHICLPAFNNLLDKKLFVPYTNPFFWLLILAFIMLTGILAGSYPAFYLSSFRPVKVLKGTFKPINALITPRKVLVVLQFTFAVTLIISTIIIRRQINYVQNRDNGYAKDNLIELSLEGDMKKNYKLIKEELLNAGVATAMCESSLSITKGGSTSTGFKWQGMQSGTNVSFDRFGTNEDFTKTFGLKILQGRDINISKFATDTAACMLNETAVKAMGFKDPVGQVVSNGEKNFKVVGVFKDIILGSPYQSINPMVVLGTATWANLLNIRFSSTKPTSVNLAKTEAVLKKYNPAYPFEYRFIDEEYARKFEDAQRTSTFTTVFAILTIFISCLGLFGLAAYMAENRTKEIGIRKVLGASVSSITSLLARDFIKLVIISILVASPLAWWSMNNWLQNYQYRISVSWWIFMLAGAITLFIALATVSFQAIKAAIANPVKNLRSE